MLLERSCEVAFPAAVAHYVATAERDKSPPRHIVEARAARVHLVIRVRSGRGSRRSRCRPHTDELQQAVNRRCARAGCRSRRDRTLETFNKPLQGERARIAQAYATSQCDGVRIRKEPVDERLRIPRVSPEHATRLLERNAEHSRDVSNHPRRDGRELVLVVRLDAPAIRERRK